jgi:hypothetical protein
MAFAGNSFWLAKLGELFVVCPTLSSEGLLVMIQELETFIVDFMWPLRPL